MSEACSTLPTYARRGAKVLVTPVIAGAVTLAGHAAPVQAAPLPAAPLPAAPVQTAPVQAAPVQAAAKSYRVYARYGSRGNVVRYVQRKVRVTVDGIYGPITTAAVKRFQRSKGLRASGVVGPTTWKALARAAAASGGSASRARSSRIGARALAIARTKTGHRYVYGGSGPNVFDCSGLTMWAYGRLGIRLPHSARAQRAMTRRVSRPAVGDFVFVHRGRKTGGVSHVGFYAGNGRWFDAGNSRRPINEHKAWYKTRISYGRL